MTSALVQMRIDGDLPARYAPGMDLSPDIPTRTVTCGSCGCVKLVPVGAWLRQRREAAGLSPADLAVLVGCHVSLVQRCEYDLRTPPEALVRACLELGDGAAHGSRSS
jgi:hypothetical protein